MYWIAKLTKNKLVLTLSAAMILGCLVSPMAVMANTGGDTLFGLDTFGNQTELGDAELPSMVASIINVALSLLGIVAIVIILLGGFKWMTAGGNDEKVTEARKLIFAGVIGMAIILSSYAIARFVLQSLTSATQYGEV